MTTEFEAEAARQLAVEWWDGDGDPPAEFVEAARGTFACQIRALRLAVRSLAETFKETVRWN